VELLELTILKGLDKISLPVEENRLWTQELHEKAVNDDDISVST